MGRSHPVSNQVVRHPLITIEDTMYSNPGNSTWHHGHQSPVAIKHTNHTTNALKVAQCNINLVLQHVLRLY